MKTLILLLTLLIPLLTISQNIGENADKVLTSYTLQHTFSGNVLIAKKGKIVFEKAYGYADKDKNQLNDLQTEFRAGSLTKMFTSTLILQLLEAGKVKLTDRINAYLPQFENGDKITIKNLLSHTSGIRGTTKPNDITLYQMVNGFKQEPLAFKPGERFEYNNFNYILLGYIAEKITGKAYSILIKNMIFDKAGMNHSGFDYEERKSGDRALGYVVNTETKNLEKSKSGNVAAAASAGALYTTIGDLFKWSNAINNHTLLSAKSYEQAFLPVIGNYGLGWMIDKKNGRFKIGHTGSIEGFMADFIKFPKEDVTIIFLSNLQDMIDYHISNVLTAIAFNEPYTEQKTKVEITLPESTLKKYIGSYESNGDRMVVSFKDRQLFVLAPGGDTAELTPEAEGKFFIKGPEISIEFRRESGKDVMFVDVHGGQSFIKVAEHLLK